MPRKNKKLASYSRDKGLVSKINKELKKFNSKRTNYIISKWTNLADNSQKKYKCLIII
jgi:hypothetical protein